MDPNQKYMAHILFQNKIHSYEGQSFEDFFVKVMKARYDNFHGVKTQGSLGDMKNDGYNFEDGKFFQVYSPLEIEKSIQKAITKIDEDVTGMINLWNGISEIYFVMNDKYKNANVGIHQKLATLREKIHLIDSLNSITIRLWTANDLERLFFEIPEDKMIPIISAAFLSSESLEDVDYAVLNRVVEFISKLESKPLDEKYFAPDFDEKIEFNGLSEEISSRLHLHYLDRTDIQHYFDNTNNLIEDKIKEKMVNLYYQAKEQCDNANLIYAFIIDNATPKGTTKFYSYCVESLIAFYFETCDIFEEPRKGGVDK